MDNHLFNVPLGGMSEEEAQNAKQNIPEELWDRDLFQKKMFSHPTPPTQPPKVEHKQYKKRKPNPQADQNAKEYKRALRGEREWGVVKKKDISIYLDRLCMPNLDIKEIEHILIYLHQNHKLSIPVDLKKYLAIDADFEGLRKLVLDNLSKNTALMDVQEAKKQVWDIYQSLIFPKNPILTPSLKKALNHLTHYFINSQEGELDLNKGILIWGGVGTSKTTLLKTFEEFTKVNDLPTKFQFSKMERLVEVATTEPKALPNHLKALTQQNRVFDDWGVEVNDKWGDGKTYFNNIILARYKKRANIKTHFTTNYSLSPKNLPNLEQIYSPRIISRLKEMVNLVGLGEGDLRG